MSNIFKNQSRFSVLMEDTELVKNDKKQNANNNNNIRFRDETEKKNNNFKRDDRRNLFNYNPEKEKQKVKKLEEEKIKKNLDISNFPEIVLKIEKKQITDNKNPSFLEKLNTVKENQNKNEPEEKIITDGWVSISFENRRPTYKFGKMSYFTDKVTKTTPNHIMFNLVELHENRKAEYIEKWGEEDYENTFLFKNYDYDYFNNLDEIYDMEIEKLELETIESEEEQL